MTYTYGSSVEVRRKALEEAREVEAELARTRQLLEFVRAKTAEAELLTAELAAAREAQSAAVEALATVSPGEAARLWALDRYQEAPGVGRSRLLAATREVMRVRPQGRNHYVPVSAGVGAGLDVAA